jgi:hypothetical protein
MVDERGTDDRVPTSAVVGVGCLTAIGGFFAGGMIAVLIAKIVGFFTRCQAMEGTPACNWHVYAAIGCVIGFISLPTISIWRLKGRRS